MAAASGTYSEGSEALAEVATGADSAAAAQKDLAAAQTEGKQPAEDAATVAQRLAEATKMYNAEMVKTPELAGKAADAIRDLTTAVSALAQEIG
jgi:hypothetical protein